MLNVIGYFHLAVPEHNAGSETTVWAALRALVQRGHRCRIICDRSATAPYTHDGIEVVRPPRRGQQSWLEGFVRDCDLLVTHLDLTSLAMQLAMSTKKPLVHFVHNAGQLMYWRVIPLKAQLVVFNSEWIANLPCAWANQGKPRLWEGPSITSHPIVEPHHYRCERGTKVTLVNPTPGKGVATLKALAKEMPDHEFLAVAGGYGQQMLTESYENIEFMAHTPDIREVFRKTKVLLMPSEYESYGRVGVEATCAGIPVIAHPTQGLWEALGDQRDYPADAEYGLEGSMAVAREVFSPGLFNGGLINGAGIFCHRDDTPSWKAQIERLYSDEVYYQQRSNAALALAESLEPEKEFDRLEAAFIETVNRWNGGQEDGKVNIWVSDRWIWRLEDGSYKATDNQRIPPTAVTLFAGKGTEVSRELAVRNGWVTDGKAISAPAENKAIQSPKENKSKKVA